MRGPDVACRSGGVVVDVAGRHPRAVPVLCRYQARLTIPVSPYTQSKSSVHPGRVGRVAAGLWSV